jgi:HTH-type transcriptional regulator/antitoxin HipB
MQTLNVPTQLQQAIIARRKKLKLSQANVASRLGISQNRYSELESSIELITLDRLLVLMSVLELELQFGLKGDVKPPMNPGAIW